MSNRIKTVRGFVDWVKELPRGSILYRGLADKNWPVEASAYRRIKNHPGSDIFKDYVLELLESARRLGLGHRTDTELSNLDLLANLQHHGAATCLIDFTQSPLTALWFACKDEPKKDGKVIGMNADDTNLFKIVDSDQQTEKIKYFFDKKGLWKWQPRDINNRIVAQQSIFVFGEPNIKEDHYDTVIISRGSKKTLIEELEKYYNISEVTLFRDISGFSLANAHNKIYTGHSEEYYSSLGVSAYQKRDFKNVIYYYSKVIEINRENTNAYYNRGTARFNLGDHKDAVEDYDKAIELNPNFTIAYNNRGNARSDLGDHRGAIKDYDKAIELNPNFAGAYNNRGIARGKPSSHEGEIEDYNKAIELNPNYADAYNNRGIARSDLGDHEGAIKDYDKAIELNPNYADTYNNRGIAREGLGDLEGAIKDYDKAIELNPNDAETYNNRGIAREELGDLEGAIKDHDKAIELNPNDAETYNNRSIAREELGDLEGAKEDLAKFAELTNINAPDSDSET